MEYKSNTKVMMEENTYEYAKRHNEIYEFWTGKGKYYRCGGECNRNMHSPEDYLFLRIEGENGESKMYEAFNSQMCMILDADYHKASDGLFVSLNQIWCLLCDFYDSHRFKTQLNASDELKQKLHESYDFIVTQGHEKNVDYLDSIISKKQLLKENFGFEF